MKVNLEDSGEQGLTLYNAAHKHPALDIQIDNSPFH